MFVGSCGDCVMRVFDGRQGRVALLAVAILMLAGCKSIGGSADVTGSITPSQEAYRKLAETWGKRYQANPGDKMASLNYARALRGMDEKAQAASVLQQAAARNPDDPEVLAAYGKVLVETGQLEQARGILSRAHTPDLPNARVLSAQGVIADQSGDHSKAQALYRSALKQDPSDPVVLTNLGLSLILSKQPGEAETILRRAVASPRADARMRETLAFALTINGRRDEAASVLGVDMPPAAAREKVAALQQSAEGEGLTHVARQAQLNDPPLRLSTPVAAKTQSPMQAQAKAAPIASGPPKPALAGTVSTDAAATGPAIQLRTGLSDN
jgi:Flp pilus assembly protein TadD